MNKALLKFKNNPNLLKLDYRIYSMLAEGSLNHRVTSQISFNSSSPYFTLNSCEYITDYSKYYFAQIGNNKLFIHKSTYRVFKSYFESDKALSATDIINYIFKEDVPNVITLELIDANSQ